MPEWACICDDDDDDDEEEEKWDEAALCQSTFLKAIDDSWSDTDYWSNGRHFVFNSFGDLINVLAIN